MSAVLFKGRVFRMVGVTRNDQLWAKAANKSAALSEVASKEGIDDYNKKQQAKPVADELRGVLRDLMIW
jgi:hypothetical protein